MPISISPQSHRAHREEESLLLILTHNSPLTTIHYYPTNTPPVNPLIESKSNWAAGVPLAAMFLPR